MISIIASQKSGAAIAALVPKRHDPVGERLRTGTREEPEREPEQHGDDERADRHVRGDRQPDLDLTRDALGLVVPGVTEVTAHRVAQATTRTDGARNDRRRACAASIATVLRRRLRAEDVARRIAGDELRHRRR